MSNWFDAEYYLHAKLVQVNASGQKDSNGDSYNSNSLIHTVNAAGMTLEQHYLEFGRKEGLAPNDFFNENYYLNAKTAKLNADGTMDTSGRAYSVSSLETLLDSMGMSPIEHYEQFGAKEIGTDGTLLDPSAQFNADAYLNNKLHSLKTTGSESDKQFWGNKNTDDLINTLSKAEFSPLSHYLTYGRDEGISPLPSPNPEPSTPTPNYTVRFENTTLPSATVLSTFDSDSIYIGKQVSGAKALALDMTSFYHFKYWHNAKISLSGQKTTPDSDGIADTVTFDGAGENGAANTSILSSSFDGLKLYYSLYNFGMEDQIQLWAGVSDNVLFIDSKPEGSGFIKDSLPKMLTPAKVYEMANTVGNPGQVYVIASPDPLANGSGEAFLLVSGGKIGFEDDLLVHLNGDCSAGTIGLNGVNITPDGLLSFGA